MPKRSARSIALKKIDPVLFISPRQTARVRPRFTPLDQGLWSGTMWGWPIFEYPGLAEKRGAVSLGEVCSFALSTQKVEVILKLSTYQHWQLKILDSCNSFGFKLKISNIAFQCDKRVCNFYFSWDYSPSAR